MTKASDLKKINIRPGVSILSVLRHLNYRPWYALAEFVDNSLQSFLTNREKINKADGRDTILWVAIEFDPSEGGRLIIRDNAAGIYQSEYARAFRPAEIPADTSGLCEFGMGMKSAACWFGRNWIVRTKALGEPIERIVKFNIDKIVQDRIEELEVKSRPIQPGKHYTEIIISDLNQPPQGRTISKIKDHLASIYRVFLRQNVIQLFFNNDPLAYTEPAILSAPYYRDRSGTPVIWRKDVDFDFGLGLKATGFAALRATASLSMAGFALFRRNRVIQGSGDETYRPEVIFGKSNSYRYQRLFGELHLEGFEISHTKDGFRWDQNEEPFLDELKNHLDDKPLPLLDQAEGHRVRPPQNELQQNATIATERTANVIEREVPPVLSHQITAEPDRQPPPQELPKTHAQASSRQIDVELNGQPWQIIVETTVDPAIGDWISISDKPDLIIAGSHRKIRRVSVRMSLAHPFMDRFCGSDEGSIEAILRIAAGLGLSQTAARDVGATMTNTIIRNLNELLLNALSKP